MSIRENKTLQVQAGYHPAIYTFKTAPTDTIRTLKWSDGVVDTWKPRFVEGDPEAPRRFHLP